ncbi:MAG: FecR family protein, partial [Spirochaetaceae bacterium]|nr:FecR family protein [Spirochaetaceae bacterium]
MKKLLETTQKLRFLLAGLVFFFSVFAAAAQSEVVAVLEYCDYPDQMQITDSDGFTVREIYFGMELGPGDTIRTENTAAEMRLTRNGSIIRLAPYTFFRIESLEGARGSAENAFFLREGKLHAIVSAAAVRNFLVRTPSAAGREGTDYALSVQNGGHDAAAVREGTLSFTKNASGQTIIIPAGKGGDAAAAVFEPLVYTGEQIEEIFYDLEFVMLEPGGVRRDLEPKEPVLAVAPPPPPPVEKVPEAVEQAAYEYGSPEWLGDILGRHLSAGAELGAVTIDRKTYTQLVVEPRITIGRLTMALYFPFVFRGDFTSPSNRYHPQGNNEWDFGKQVNQSQYSDAGRKDFLRDLILKIHYVEYGKPGEEFFVNAGSFRGMTLGHGSLVYKYANDVDFPFVRRVGLHTGFDMGFMGFEAFSADLAESDIFGGRLFTRPMPALSLGFSVVTDKHPIFTVPEDAANAFVVSSGISARDIDPLVTGFALDADFSMGEKGGDSITFFADMATLIPTLRHKYAASDVGSTHGF